LVISGRPLANPLDIIADQRNGSSITILTENLETMGPTIVLVPYLAILLGVMALADSSSIRCNAAIRARGLLAIVRFASATS